MSSFEIKFSQLSNVLEKITRLSENKKKRKHIEEFFKEYRENAKKVINRNLEESFFDVLRLLLPQLDKDREAYGIKEHTLAVLYIELLGLGKASENGQRLLNYKSPKTGVTDTGDFASVAYWILKDRCPSSSQLSISNINESLDLIAQGHATKNKPEVKKTLLQLIKNASALEQKWIIRIIMKDLKIGIGAKAIFAAFHPDAEDLYNVKMSLKKVCNILTDLNIRLHEIEISINTPFRPMLGERQSPSTIEKTIKGRPFLVEIKYDGERMQIHFLQNQFKFYSRGGFDYTHVFGKDFSGGTLTPFLVNAFKKNVHNFILDGEMVGFNNETQTIGTKGENFDVKSADITIYHPMFCIFDILLLNDKVLTNQPLKERKNILAGILVEVPGRLVPSKYEEKYTGDDCMEALNRAIDAREEGIMIKDSSSVYKPNCRTKSGWYKIKPDYIGGLMDELDLLIVGGYYGIGSRSNMVSHFLLAAALEGGTSNPTVFYSVCKVGSGYTHKELFDLNIQLGNSWVPFKKEKPPSWLLLADGFKQKPDAVIIDPSKSVILQVRASEITESDQYKVGLTLRFPRVEKIRHDKPWYDCMTVQQIILLKEESGGKLASKHFSDSMMNESPSKKPRITTRQQASLPVHLMSANADDVTQISDILEGKELCVLSGSNIITKVDVEKMILGFGGTIVQNPGKDTFCVLAGKMTIKVENLMTNKLYNIASLDWFHRCIEAEELLDWEPSDLIGCTKEMNNLLGHQYDKYGDSYYDTINEDKLQSIFHKMPQENIVNVTNDEIAELEMKYFPLESLNGIFRLCRIFVPNDDQRYLMHLLEINVRLHGATICKEETDNRITHIIIHPKYEQIDKFHEINRKRNKLFHIVNCEWIYACLSKGVLIPENGYYL